MMFEKAQKHGDSSLDGFQSKQARLAEWARETFADRVQNACLMADVYAQMRGHDVEVVCPTEGRAYILTSPDKISAVIAAVKSGYSRSGRVLIRPEIARDARSIAKWCSASGMTSKQPVTPEQREFVVQFLARCRIGKMTPQDNLTLDAAADELGIVRAA